MSQAEAKTWQFSLRGLFAVTTAFALAAVVAARLGAGTLFMSSGLILIALNARGTLSFMQTAWARPRILYPVWLLFVASLFMPAAKGCNGKVLVGWETAAEVGKIQVDGIRKLATEPDVRKEVISKPVQFAFSQLSVGLLNAANVLMALLPLCEYQWRRERGRLASAVLLWGAVTVWMLTWDEPNDFLYGFYVWCGCITVAAMTRPVSWRVAQGAAVLAAIYVALHVRGDF